MRSSLNLTGDVRSWCGSGSRTTPSIAPVTTAVMWDGAQWRWTQWTGADWIALPRTALLAQPAVADSVGASRTATIREASMLAAREPNGYLKVALRPARKASDWPGPLAMFTGHVVAALMGLVLGYYVLCCLRPAEFNHWDLPVPHGTSVSGN